LPARGLALAAAVASLLAGATHAGADAPFVTAANRSRSPYHCRPRDPEWQAWFSSVFKSAGPEVFGPDPRRLTTLTGEKRTLAEEMLRRGIKACDIFAVEAIEGAGWRALVPDLRPATTAEDADFQARVVVALKRLGSTDDVTDDLIAVLSAPSMQARMTAAMGARLFSLDRMRAPLLERVRRDPSWFVRLHAAESLLQLAGVEPPDVNQYPRIAEALADRPGRQESPYDYFELRPPPKEDLARYAEAARLLDAAITERLAAGACPKPEPLTTIDLHFVRVSERVAALTVEEGIGPCDRTLAFEALVRAEGGFRRLSIGIMGKSDPLHTSLETSPSPLAVEYQRASKVLAIGPVVVDTTATNVVGLVYGPKGVAVSHRGTQSLSFDRRGRPPPAMPGLMGSHDEVTDAVRSVVDRSPELRALVSADQTTSPPR
jgi:hypothetical protein